MMLVMMTGKFTGVQMRVGGGGGGGHLNWKLICLAMIGKKFYLVLGDRGHGWNFDT